MSVCCKKKNKFSSQKNFFFFKVSEKYFSIRKMASSRKNTFDLEETIEAKKNRKGLKMDIVEYVETGRGSILPFLGLDLFM